MVTTTTIRGLPVFVAWIVVRATMRCCIAIWRVSLSAGVVASNASRFDSWPLQGKQVSWGYVFLPPRWLLRDGRVLSRLNVRGIVPRVQCQVPCSGRKIGEKAGCKSVGISCLSSIISTISSIVAASFLCGHLKTNRQFAVSLNTADWEFVTFGLSVCSIQTMANCVSSVMNAIKFVSLVILLKNNSNLCLAEQKIISNFACSFRIQKNNLNNKLKLCHR